MCKELKVTYGKEILLNMKLAKFCTELRWADATALEIQLTQQIENAGG